MPRPPHRPEEIEAQRQRILDAAHELMHEGGPDAATMRRIAGRVGLSHMALYRYFPNREAIFHALRARHLEQLNALRNEQIARAEAGAVLEVLHEELTRFWEMAQRRPEIYRLMFCGVSTSPAGCSQEPFASGLRRRIQHLARLISIGIEQRIFKDCDPEMAALVIITVVNGPLIFQMADRLPPNVDGEQLWRTVFKLAITYLTGR